MLPTAQIHELVCGAANVVCTTTDSAYALLGIAALLGALAYAWFNSVTSK
jgi:hypothetical protein